MPRNPDVPCAGGCGRMCWRSRTCRPPGEQMCRACRSAAREPLPANALCAFCGVAFRSVKRSDGRLTQTCSKRCAGCHLAVLSGKSLGRLSEKRRLELQAKCDRRRAIMRIGDVTPTYVAALRAAAKDCPLCDVELIDTPFLSASKELDHMVPLNPACGGTHTIGNVRIICRACNIKRPKDGSDYIGPITLWAQVG